MATVAIDAGHGGRDPGAVFQGRQEKDDVLKLALAVGDLLNQAGIDVVYTRTEDVYDTPYQKAVIANENNADFLISLHRNAVPIAGSASGVETLVYADRGLPAEMARAINSELQALGFLNRGVIERPNLAILRRSQMPAVLVEVGFIDNPSDNDKFDQEFDTIARAIADGVLSIVPNMNNLESSALEIEEELEFEARRPPRPPHGSPMPPRPPQEPPMPPPRPYPQPPTKLYRVQVGAFKNRNLAYQLSNQLTQEGYPAFILMDDDLYKVQVGAFARLDNAIRMEYRLKAAGYDTYIAT